MIVYKITNTVNGKAYIGVTRQKLAARWRCHRAQATFGTTWPIYAAMRKYGVDNFTIETICECSSLDELAVCERALIAAHGTYTPWGYNITIGGEGCHTRVVSEETRAKLRAACKRNGSRPRQPDSYKHSPETRAKMSEAKKGKWKPTEEMLARAAERSKGDGNPLRRIPGLARRIADMKAGIPRSAETVAKIIAARRAQSKLTDEDIINIRKLVATGRTHSAVAKRFGISRQYVGSLSAGDKRVVMEVAR